MYQLIGEVLWSALCLLPIALVVALVWCVVVRDPKCVKDAIVEAFSTAAGWKHIAFWLAVYVLADRTIARAGMPAWVALIILATAIITGRLPQYAGRFRVLSIAVFLVLAYKTFVPEYAQFAFESGLKGRLQDWCLEFGRPQAETNEPVLDAKARRSREFKKKRESLYSTYATTSASEAAVIIQEDAKLNVEEATLNVSLTAMVSPSPSPSPEPVFARPIKASSTLSLAAPPQVSAKPTVVTTTIVAGSPTIIAFPQLAKGWTVGVRSAGNWDAVLLKGANDSKFQRAEVCVTKFPADERDKILIVKAGKRIPPGQCEQVVLVFCPPGVDILEAYNAPLDQEASE